MTVELEEFAKELFQDVLSDADAEERFAEDVFFDKVTSILMDTGELDSADRAEYHRPSSGIRVDGYGGDPLESNGTLSLIVLDYNQSETLGSMNRADMEATLARPVRFLKEALKPAWREELEESSSGFGLADLVCQRWHHVNRIRVVLLSNRQLKIRVDGVQADSVDGKTVTHSVWDIGRLHRFVSSGKEREAIEIELQEEFGTKLPVLPAHLSAENYESYLAVVPGKLLGAIYDKWGPRLLEQNVRVFLQARGNVNKGIRRTIENDPEMFFAYNNGITATAEAVSTAREDGRLLLASLRNFQIVNGGQTTASIHAAYRNKVDLSGLFVQMKLSIVDPVKTKEIVPKISEYANSQNRVNAADFFANHPFHVRMEEFSRRLFAPSPDGTFRETKWFYERARGQYADARSQLTQSQRKRFDLEHPRKQLLSKTDLAKFMNVWRAKPHEVSLGAQKNFALYAKWIGAEWDKNENNFNEGFFKEVVAKAIVFKMTEKLVSAQDWYEGGYRANIVAYALAKIAHDVQDCNMAVDCGQIWRKQEISRAMTKVIEEASKAVFRVLINPPSGISNVTEWAKKQACWSSVRELRIDYPSSFTDELISRDAQRSQKSTARTEQKELNGIVAQTKVVQAGADFWAQVARWAQNTDLLTPKDKGILDKAILMPRKIPSEAQSIALLRLLNQLNKEGFSTELP